MKVNKSGFNSFQLKCIAIITMLIDHIGAILFPAEIGFRIIGRLSFPIFCFLLVEGFYHTGNVKKYMIRLGIFALISEIPYDLAFRNVFLEFQRQNVFFTLLLGIALMYMLQRTNRTYVRICYILLAMWTALQTGMSYDCRGILLIMIYYVCRNNIAAKVVLGGAWNLLWTGVQQFGVLASIPIALYNGEKGKSMKYVFYVFYPVHLLILYIISSILMK